MAEFAHPITQRDWDAMVATKDQVEIAKSIDPTLSETDCRYIIADAKIKGVQPNDTL